MKTIITISLIILLQLVSLNAKTYYIDATNGNDNNTDIVVSEIDYDFEGNNFLIGSSPDIGAFEYSSIEENAEAKFLDYSFIGSGYRFIATNPSDEPWVPNVVIDKSKIIWVSPNGIGNGDDELNPTTLSSALTSNPVEGTTIIAIDGIYPLDVRTQKLKFVNVISKNKYGAVIKTVNKSAITFSNNQDIHHVNFIGFEVIGGGQFIFSPSTLVTAVPHHIYLSDIKMHDLFMGIYSGLHSYNWTMDRCLFYNSKKSYMWYMMGFHHTVMNSVMYNNSYLSIAIRGHYPLDEDYNWRGGNSLVKNREHGYLDKDDWTHKIINNTFGTNHNNSRPHKAHLGLFYNIIPEEEANGDGEASYLPPQNVVVANNVFVDEGTVDKIGFDIWAERGINTGAIDAVNGLVIKNNVTSKSILVSAGDNTDISAIANNEGNTLNSSSIYFVDETGRNYHLTELSTDLINKGATNVYKPNNDFEGNKRDSNIDVGAYEYILGTSISTSKKKKQQ